MVKAGLNSVGYSSSSLPLLGANCGSFGAFCGVQGMTGHDVAEIGLKRTVNIIIISCIIMQARQKCFGFQITSILKNQKKVNVHENVNFTFCIIFQKWFTIPPNGFDLL